MGSLLEPRRTPRFRNSGRKIVIENFACRNLFRRGLKIIIQTIFAQRPHTCLLPARFLRGRNFGIRPSGRSPLHNTGKWISVACPTDELAADFRNARYSDQRRE
jgi:hypothetical protein